MAMAKKGAGGASKAARSGKASVAVDKKLKARWADAISRYRKARTEETEGWDERYEALGEILESDPPYYLAGGFKTARAFLAAEAPGQDERTVRRYVRVARHFAPADEARHGIAKLDALLDYLEAAGGSRLAPAKLDLARQRVAVTEGRATRQELFSALSTEEIRRARRALLGAKSKIGKNQPTAVRALRAALTKARLGSVGVRLTGGRLHLSAIPLDALAKLAKVLAVVRIGG